MGVGPALTVGFALVGALLAVIEGDDDGDGRAGPPVPFVCMPGGIGRLAFPAGTGCGAAVATGPMASVNEGFARASGRVRSGYPDRFGRFAGLFRGPRATTSDGERLLRDQMDVSGGRVTWAASLGRCAVIGGVVGGRRFRK